MKYRNNKFAMVVAAYISNLVFFFAVTVNINAQECKRKLEEFNRRQEFPTGQLNEYMTCLNKLDSDYKTHIGVEQEKKIKIAELKADAVKNKNALNQARENRDSVRIDSFKKKEKDLDKDIEKLNGEVADSNAKAEALKNILADSYNKIIDYFTTIEDSRKNEFQRKLDALIAEN